MQGHKSYHIDQYLHHELQTGFSSREQLFQHFKPLGKVIIASDCNTLFPPFQDALLVSFLNVVTEICLHTRKTVTKLNSEKLCLPCFPAPNS